MEGYRLHFLKFFWHLYEEGAATGAMTWWLCLWVILAADVVQSNQTGPAATCQPLQQTDDSNLLHVECTGLGTLQDVREIIKQDLWPHLGSLTILKSNLTGNLTLDDLVNYPSVHTLTFKNSQLKEWKRPRIPSVPRVRKLVLEKCWDSEAFLVKHKKLSLTLNSELADALPHLEELHLIDIYLPLTSVIRAMKNLKKFIMEKGAAKCTPTNLWLLEWYDAGKLDIKSTVSFVAEDPMDNVLPFTDVNLIGCLQFMKSAIDDCPSPCKCELFGFQSKKKKKIPITNVNCASANMTEVPDIIPSHTSNLILSNNSIRDISKVFISPRYRSLNTIILENNLVDYVDVELLSRYLHNHSLDFRINLNYNKLETLPAEYLLKMYTDYAGRGHSLLPHILLSGNQWNCDDCAFLVPFQRVVYYQSQGKDELLAIKCGQGRYSEGEPVIMVPVDSYCNKDHLDPLDILNICLGILLLLFILNFIYNLIQYHRHGKLPWIVTKVPCC